MMMLLTAVKVYIAAEPIDMRKSIDSLSMRARPMFDQNGQRTRVLVLRSAPGQDQGIGHAGCRNFAGPTYY